MPVGLAVPGIGRESTNAVSRWGAIKGGAGGIGGRWAICAMPTRTVVRPPPMRGLRRVIWFSRFQLSRLLRQSGRRRENQCGWVRRVRRVEVEHAVDRTGDGIERSASNPPQIPVVLDKTGNGSLDRKCMIDVVSF